MANFGRTGGKKLWIMQEYILLLPVHIYPNYFKLRNNLYAHSYILHKYEKGGHQKNYLFGVPMVLICSASPVQNFPTRLEVPEALFMKTLVLCDVTSCSLAIVTSMLQACSAFVSQFNLFNGRCIVSASSEPIAQWHRVVPQTNGKIQVRGFAMTCAPCSHEYITGLLFWANPFFKIILILSCRLRVTSCLRVVWPISCACFCPKPEFALGFRRLRSLHNFPLPLTTYEYTLAPFQ